MINLSRAVRLKSMLSKADVNQLGHHKVDRYLYHLTSAENYQKIKASGFIKTSTDCTSPLLEGVFMFDLKNFLKNWRCSRDWAGGNLGLKLLGHAAKKKTDLVMLRIPAAQLDHYSLKIRSQNMLFNKQRQTPATKQHVMNGEAVCFNKEFTRKGHAIEYIYEDRIPLQNIEFVGEVNSRDVASHLPKNATQGLWVRETLNQLLAGQPEKKMLDYFS